MWEHKKGAVTPLEIPLLAVGTTILIVIYQVVMQGVTENIALGTAGNILDKECTFALISGFLDNYDRSYGEVNTGSYGNLSDFYDVTGYEASIPGYEIVEGPGGRCSVYLFSPKLMHDSPDTRLGFTVYSGIKSGGEHIAE